MLEASRALQEGCGRRHLALRLEGLLVALEAAAVYQPLTRAALRPSQQQAAVLASSSAVHPVPLVLAALVLAAGG